MTTSTETKAADRLDGVWEGVPLSCISDDGDLILLTADRAKAIAAATAYFNEVGVDATRVNFDYMPAHWAVFEWQPEGAERPWTVRMDATEGDVKAVRVHYLPA